MVQRYTYRRRHAYATRSNKVRKLRTPGGRLTIAYLGKKPSLPKCGDCGHQLQGIPAARPKALHGLKAREVRVSRVYGGSRCAGCVRSRIVRAFLIEEQKIVKSVLKSRGSKKASA